MRAKFESFDPAVRPWLPFVQNDLEGTRIDITEESAAGPNAAAPVYPEVGGYA